MENLKPAYYFNGYAAYKNFYLVSSDIEFSRFVEIVEGILWERANLENKPEWLVSLQKFIADNFGEDIQIFLTPNWVGDTMEFVKAIGKIQVYYCPGYHYIEVLGLSKTEKELAKKFVLNECEDGSWASYLKSGQIGEVK